MADSILRSVAALDHLDLPEPDVVRRAIDAVRVLSMDAVEQANSGHPGTPMALAPAGYLVWRHHLRHNPANPGWANRDRFVLSVGHASMLMYSLLHLTGYDLPESELRDFRQWGSRTAGHPEVHHTPGVETTTGPLGQGVANSVGMALAERWLAARFNRPGHSVVDHRTIAFCSDGDLMEGISHEAAELAGHQRLGKLLWIFDDNEITIEGSTELASSTRQTDRFESYGWHVQQVDDGNDLAALDRAIRAAEAETERPSFIALRTVIGWGSPNMAGKAAAHGAPLGADEIRATKEALGYPSMEPFHVPEDARAEWARAGDRGKALEADWNQAMEAYREAHPELASELDRYLAGELPSDWEEGIPDLSGMGKAEATRATSGKVIQGLAARIPNLVGGSADLGPSNKTDIEGAASLLPGSPDGRTLHFGVREHAMGAILNGIALHGGLRAFAGTFLIFSDYMRPAIRLAALMECPVTHVFTHDSIGLGEDGPTHQPVEQLMTLRAIPGLMDLRPADAVETAEAWAEAIRRTDGPSFLALTRQGVPRLDRSTVPGHADGESGVARGGYVFREAKGGTPQCILLASGSELQLALEAAGHLEEEDGIPTRVVSLPSWFLFRQQDPSWRDAVLPPEVRARVAVEAGTTRGWEAFTGLDGAAVGLDRFGASAPAPTLYREFGITADAVRAAALESVRRSRMA
ncbi:MAG: transketolase [Gemmatimonadales bacterium]|nr:MAG: transketolase [Gemmatimonadales bacterium]